MILLQSFKIKTLLLPLLLVTGLIFIRLQYGVLIFETLVVLFSIIIGVLMLVIVWNTRQFTRNDFLVYLGIGYFWIAVLDSWHTFTVNGMPFFDISNSEVTLHLWVSTRFLEAIIMLSALLFLNRKLNPGYLFYLGAIVVLVVIWGSFELEQPVMFNAEGLTSFKVYTEYVVIILLGWAIYLYTQYRQQLPASVFHFLLMSMLFTIFAEFFLTLYSDFNSAAFVVGHLFKLLSFWLIYQAIVQTTLTEPFSVMAKSSSSYNAIPYPAIVVDCQGIVSQVNRAAEQFCGEETEALKGQHVHRLFHPVETSIVDCKLCQAMTEGKQLEAVVVAFEQNNKCFLTSLARINSDDIKAGMVLTLTDVSEQKFTEKALRVSEERFQDFATVAADLFWEMDQQLRFTYVSGKVDQLMGADAESILGKNRQELYAKQSSVETPAFKHHLQVLDEHKPFTDFEVSWDVGDGELCFIHVSGFPRFDTTGNFLGYRGVSRDVTDSKLSKDKIMHQAHFDSLTELPNRFLSLDRLSQLLTEAHRNNEKVAVLFLDLDDFKKVNDSLGHEAGDHLLIEAAERLRHVVRAGDTVGRLGGDEFIILLGSLNNAADARPIAENLLNRFRDSFKVGGRDLMLTTSVGISIYPEDGRNASELLRNADSAMYHSKELGRNTYSYFTDDMNRDISRRLALEEQIHGALDRHEFSVYYQSQIDINSDHIMGAEALLRWKNPALGQVSPAEFIPIAEQTGLIVPLGQFVLKQALENAAYWQQQFDNDFRIAVNLSPRQFRDPNLITSIEQILRQSSVDNKSLELEITEGVLMSGHRYIDDALKALSEMNISIAMDDFGTGYSSLSYLRRYPFNVLKIDQSFIRDITEDAADRELITATIAMAHGLNLKVVAEGVETTQQLDYLKSLNCDFVQGYLFGKPVSASELSEILKKESEKTTIE